MSFALLPRPPVVLAHGAVTLRFLEISPGDPARGFVPAYRFQIVEPAGATAGTINFRVGHTPHVQLYAGHIGYTVDEAFRGRGYALQACRALAPLVRAVYVSVIITCDPDNVASRRTLERLGTTFLEELPVAPDDPHFARGSRSKLRFRWVP